MSGHKPIDPQERFPGGWGVMTPWTMLVGDQTQAGQLEHLLTLYLEPVLGYYRAEGLSPADAEDLTQSLLMDFFLVKSSHRNAEPSKGRFRNYLLAAARHALLDWRKHGKTIRRGGNKKRFSLEGLKDGEVGWEPAAGATPEQEFDRRWAMATWRGALELFRSKHDAQLVEALDLFYAHGQRLSQQEAAAQLGISVAAFNSRLYKARQRLFACLREIVQSTVEDPDDLERELAQLRDLLANSGL
ncbi:MAG: sigma-70 family RNA polymerase sigma factor [Planctomycetes bacterium]|nr:sigma-70 family RNA polymerase sigma factor [Planctomycetota bacterium]